MQMKAVAFFGDASDIVLHVGEVLVELEAFKTIFSAGYNELKHEKNSNFKYVFGRLHNYIKD